MLCSKLEENKLHLKHSNILLLAGADSARSFVRFVAIDQRPNNVHSTRSPYRFAPILTKNGYPYSLVPVVFVLVFGFVLVVIL